MRTVALLWFGLGGHALEFDGSTRVSGDETPDSFEHAVPAGEYAAYALDGVPVLDKRPALERRPGLTLTMPMVDPDLRDGEERRCPEPSDPLCLGAEGAFRALAALHKTRPAFRGLDLVSVEEYLRLWRAEGARTGRFANGRIAWGTGSPRDRQIGRSPGRADHPGAVTALLPERAGRAGPHARTVSTPTA